MAEVRRGNKQRGEARKNAVAEAEKKDIPEKKPFDLEELKKFYGPGDTLLGNDHWDEEEVLSAREMYYLKHPKFKNMEELGKHLAYLQGHSAEKGKKKIV